MGSSPSSGGGGAAVPAAGNPALANNPMVPGSMTGTDPRALLAQKIADETMARRSMQYGGRGSNIAQGGASYTGSSAMRR